LDTVRADRLRLYGAERDTSYQLEAMAAAGVTFDEAHTDGAWSWPTHASLLTGRPPWEHGAHFSRDNVGVAPFGDEHAWRVDVPDPGLATLPELLGPLGYRTEVASSNGWLAAELGLTRGFDQVVTTDNDGDTLAAARAALDTDQPLLLLVNLMSAHGPYRVADEVPWAARHRDTLAEGPLAPWVVVERGVPGVDLTLRGPLGLTGEQAVAVGELGDASSILQDLYDANLVRTDAALRALIEAWNASGRAGQPVIVTSDHGEALGESGLAGHGRRVPESITHVPLVIYAPGRATPGQRVSTPVTTTRIHHTVLDLTGQPSPQSLLSDIAGSPVRAMAWADPAWASKLGPPWTDGERAVLADGTWTRSPDRAPDPDFPEGPPADVPNRALDPDLRAQLEALGYAGGP